MTSKMTLFDSFKSIIIDEIYEYLEDTNYTHDISLDNWYLYYNGIITRLSTNNELIEDVSADFVDNIIEKYTGISSGKKHLLRTIIFDSCYHFCNIYLSEEYEQEILDSYNEHLNTFN